MTGVVLCGGLSTRMGSDKAFLETNDIPWVKRITSLFEEVSIPFVISINENQQEKASQLFPDEQLIVDESIYGGPLRGILSVEKKVRDDFFVIACDLQQMEASIIQELLASFKSNSTYDCYLFKNEGFYEPLCAIYTTKGIEKMKNYFSSNLTSYSLQKVLKKELNCFSLPITKPELFHNSNSPEEI
ncbi:MAG: molybdenum cofactor guanylyltransferase [Cyclobacteriaceae bacterium]